MGPIALKITLDTNCIIDLEENRASAPSLRNLIQAHNNGLVQLRVVGISASERPRKGSHLLSFAAFIEKLANAGLTCAEILKPIGYTNVTYVNWCLCADGNMVEFEKSIHAILFPTSPFNFPPQAASKWRHEKCDVLSLWAHIYHHGDIFVSRDRNYFKQGKRRRLEELGAKRICSPEEAVRMITYARRSTN